jgi:hypothetical protein
MSLYLKMLEALSPNWQLDLLDNQLLPVLDNNIRCGNSLVGSLDFDNWWDKTRGSLFSGSDDTAFRIIHVMGKQPSTAPIDYARFCVLHDGPAQCFALDHGGTARRQLLHRHGDSCT